MSNKGLCTESIRATLTSQDYSPSSVVYVKFIYSEKAANFCKISTVDLSYVVTVKSTAEIKQKFVAFSEFMNFKSNVQATCK